MPRVPPVTIATRPMSPLSPSVHNPGALLGTHVQSLLGALREEYDAIVVDTPPVNVVADAAVIGAQSDGVIAELHLTVRVPSTLPDAEAEAGAEGETGEASQAPGEGSGES